MKYLYIIITFVTVYAGIGVWGEITHLTTINTVSREDNIVYFETH